MRLPRTWTSRSMVGGAACALLLAGCASVPTSGPVTIGEPVGADRRVESVVGPPADGATPQDIVEGFLAANAKPADDYALARSYLAPEVGQAWNPAAGAIVYDDVSQTLTQRGTKILLTAPQQGTLSPAGSFTASPKATVLRNREFTVRQVDGQWRILGVLPGLLLTRRDIENVYGGIDRYFLNTAGDRLVPDRVLLPVSLPGIQTALVRGLLRGASPWLRPAVISAFPSGTRLAIDSVPVIDGVATVDLSKEALTTNDQTRRLMSAQLVWTLTGFGAVNGVRITVGGQPLPVAGAGEVMTRKDFAGVDPNVLPAGTAGYVLVGQTLKQLTADGATPVPGLFGEGSTALTLAAVNLGANVAAATVGVEGATGTVYTAALAADSSPVPRVRTGSLGSLSYTGGGELWVVDSAGGAIDVVPSTGRVATAVFGGAGRVVALRLARDGARAAVIVVSPNGARSLLVAAVVRSGAVDRLTSPRLVQADLTDAVDVAWADADTLVVIASTASLTRRLFDVVVGDIGFSPQIGVVGMTRVAAAPGSPVLVQVPSGVLEDTATGWQPVGGAPPGVIVRSPAYPG